MMTLVNAAGVWCLFVCAAFACRLYCQGSAEARLGERRAHLLFVAMTSLSVFLLGALHINALPAMNSATLWGIGLLWFALSLLFEVVLCRHVLGLSWRRTFRDYDLRRGRLYPLVLAMVLFTPTLSALLFFD